MSTIRVVAVLALLATLAFGCSSAPPTGPPGIIGEITALETTGAGLSMLVEGGKQPEGAVSDKAQVKVVGSTEVFDSDGSLTDADELAAGDQVTVWFEGAVAESYPVQGTASAVQLGSDTP